MKRNISRKTRHFDTSKMRGWGGRGGSKGDVQITLPKYRERKREDNATFLFTRDSKMRAKHVVTSSS